MSPVITTKVKIPLDDGWCLHVINAGPKSEIILSFNEGGDGPVRERISVHLSHSKAIQVSRALAGVTLMGSPEKM